jgi:peptidoglycan/xylan/chitin deacetylase (PgdA/CDA1 family)
MEALAASGYRVVTLGAACRWLTGDGELELPVVVLTFDDGYADNFWNAWPVLQQYRLPATIFVATGLIDSDRRMSRYIGGGAGDRMMTWVEVRELAASGLIEIGAHTVSHRELPGLPEAEAGEEIVASRRMLEERLQRTSASFAYPRGAVNETVRELVARAGFETACTVRGGINQRGMDRLMLCRTGISGHDTARDVLMKASGAFDWIHDLMDLSHR